MTYRRWIADEVSGDQAALTGEHARHVARVLRAQIGQEFDISTGSEVRRGRVLSVSPDRIDFALGERVEQSAGASVTIAMSIFKFDRMEWALEKCTELGVARIIPIIAGRTEPHLASAAGKRAERWRRVVRSAAEQSRRLAPPEIMPPAKLNELLRLAADQRICLSEVEASVSLIDVVPKGSASLLMAFGPEGGWKADELNAFQSAGWISASLGPTIHRAETAAIAAVAIATSVLRR